MQMGRISPFFNTINCIWCWPKCRLWGFHLINITPSHKTPLFVIIPYTFEASIVSRSDIFANELTHVHKTNGKTEDIMNISWENGLSHRSELSDTSKNIILDICVGWSAAAMVLNILGKRILVLHGERFQLPVPLCSVPNSDKYGDIFILAF